MLICLLASLVPVFLTLPANTERERERETETETQTLTAGCTGEACIMVEVPHGLAGLASPKHPLAAFHTGSCKRKNTVVSQEGNGVK